MQLSLFPTHKQASGHKVNGSHLQGYIHIEYDTLVEFLGEPHYTDMDKAQAEWCLEFEDGVIATLYDYKSPWLKEKVTNWHVGGHDEDSIEKIQQMFPNHKVTKL